jgi:hypothetical protein
MQLLDSLEVLRTLDAADRRIAVIREQLGLLTPLR